MKTIEERNNLDSFLQLINHNKEEILKDDWINKENWLDFIRGMANGGYDSLLDVGCHDCSITKEFKIPSKTGVDAFDKIADEASKHCSFKLMDARDISKNFEPKSFDVVCELDFIEHLEKIEEADKLMDDMESIAKKLVIHLCPANVIESENFASTAYGDMEGFTVETGHEFNSLQHHLLQPTKEYFTDKGYEVRLYGGDLKKIIAWKYL